MRVDTALARTSANTSCQSRSCSARPRWCSATAMASCRSPNPGTARPMRSMLICSRARNQARSISAGPDAGHVPVEDRPRREQLGVEHHVAEPDVAPQQRRRRLVGGPVGAAPRQRLGQGGGRRTVGGPAEVALPPLELAGEPGPQPERVGVDARGCGRRRRGTTATPSAERASSGRPVIQGSASGELAAGSARATNGMATNGAPRKPRPARSDSAPRPARPPRRPPPARPPAGPGRRPGRSRPPPVAAAPPARPPRSASRTSTPDPAARSPPPAAPATAPTPRAARPGPAGRSAPRRLPYVCARKRRACRTLSLHRRWDLVTGTMLPR